MSFNMREFLMKGFRDSIGKLDDYQVILYATEHHIQGRLTEADLAELQDLIDEKNAPKPEPEIMPEPIPLDEKGNPLYVDRNGTPYPYPVDENGMPMSK